MQLIENLLRNSVEHHATDSPTQADDAGGNGGTSAQAQALENSVPHGDAGVTVRVGPLEDGFYVEGDGPGIPVEDRDRVFDHGFSTTKDGTGYGLSIVRTMSAPTAGISW